MREHDSVGIVFSYRQYNMRRQHWKIVLSVSMRYPVQNGGVLFEHPSYRKCLYRKIWFCFCTMTQCSLSSRKQDVLHNALDRSKVRLNFGFAGVGGVSVDRRPKRRRKLMVDEQKGIDSQSMKEQLIQTNDIVTTLDLAPPTLKLMLWKESGTVDKMFGQSARNIPNKSLQKVRVIRDFYW